MKNVHLLPTDKPSRLHLAYNKDYYLSIEPFVQLDTKNYKSFNIYITSDEEIKEGDWCLSKLNEAVRFGKKFTTSLYKKIILTTDQDLIKDGVQCITNTFAEWFVKNPSCESIKVVHKFDEDWSEESGAFEISYYKIIIPQEKPKQYPIGGYAPGYYSCTCVTCKTEFMGDKRAVQCEPCAIKTTQEEPKQETLEDSIYQAIGLAANEQGIINQALATSKVMDVLKKTNL
jgi:hypothetical protein